MGIWKKASAVLQGGTQQIKSLSGKKVRVTSNLNTVNVYDAITHIQRSTNLTAGVIGFISNPHPQKMDDLLIVFPKISGQIVSDLKTLTRSADFLVVQINSPTFKQQFEIDF